MATLEDLSYEARDELALLMREMSENPSTRASVLRLTKQLRPNMPIPELEIQDHTSAIVQQSNQKVEALEAKLREKDVMAELEQRRHNLIKKGLVRDEEDIPKVEALMLEKGMTNHETAAEYFNWMQQAATPTPSGYNPSALSKFDLSAFYKNPEKAARNEAAKALGELRGPKRPIGL
jgi:hypothetical protein